MDKVGVFWDPSGFELDSLGTHKFERLTDGDTPYVSTAIRMLSIDTPEVHYPGRANPASQDAKLQQLAQWMVDGKAPIAPRLAASLQGRLATGGAGSLQKQQGDAGTAELQRLRDTRLKRTRGAERSLFLRAANRPFDDYGRLLAYMAPSYSKLELVTLSARERATFNLAMVESGWAASFPIYPSLPKYSDLNLLQQAAKDAMESRRGAWAEPLSLTGYEFRMCVKLWEITNKLVEGRQLGAAERSAWIERYCVDMTTREIYAPQEYYQVQPYNRIFIWPRDVNEAVGKLNLIPAHDA